MMKKLLDAGLEGPVCWYKSLHENLTSADEKRAYTHAQTQKASR